MNESSTANGQKLSLENIAVFTGFYGHGNSIALNARNPYKCLAIVTNVLQSIRIVYDYFTNNLRI